MSGIFVLKRLSFSRPYLTTALLAAILIGALGSIAFFTSAVMANGDGAVITGYKFYDINGIEGRNDNEPGIDDWEIKLLLPDGEEGIDEVESTETYDGGYYYFGGELADGTYLLCERQESENWSQTYPTEDTPGAVSCHGFDEELDSELEKWGWEVEIADGEVVGDIESYSFDFGNTTELGAVRAVKFSDKDRDEQMDDGEPGIPNVEICLESNNLVDSFLENLSDFFFNSFNECLPTDADGVAEWSGLPAGDYGIEENVPEGWAPTTSADQEFGLAAGETKEILFGNRQAALIVYKYDQDSGELLPGWEICLYEAIENDGDYEKGALVYPCQETLDDFDEEGGEPGQFHGAAVFPPENLDSDRWYIIDEEEKEGWRLEEADGGGLEVGWDYINWDYGLVPIRLDNSFFENAEDARLYLYNRDVAGDITVFKYFDENLGIFIPGWEICLREFDEETGLAGSIIECKDTDSESGMVSWTNLLPGTYILDEEERDGWSPQGFSTGDFENAEWEELDSEAGQVRIQLFDGGRAEIHFLNWIYDIAPPQSSFEDQFDHRVIDTEIISLELSGASVDLPLPPIIGEEPRPSGSSGVREATLTVRQLGASDAVENYPSSSFFDVFTEISCPAGESIPIEIVALSLVSADPITVSWGHNWVPPSPGIYCLEVSATDVVGNVERTAYAGPLAYVPVVEISEQTTDTPSESIFTVHWTTSEPATSRVIYDTVAHPVLGEAPNYGYAFSTETFDTDPKITDHTVAISGLSAGTTYYYRTVSSASPESVSDEDSVTTPSSSENENNDSGDDDEEISAPAASSGGGGGGIIHNTPPNQPLGAPQVPGVDEQEGGGPEEQVLGEAITLEEQIASLGAQIEELKKQVIPLMQSLIDLLAEELKKLIAQFQ